MKELRAIGHTIKNIADIKGVSAKDISETLNRPLTDVEMAFAGRMLFSIAQIKKIAELVDVSVEDIFEKSKNVKCSDYAIDYMNEFSNEENLDCILDLVYDYLDVYDSVYSK